jgi:hypothetical protein
LQCETKVSTEVKAGRMAKPDKPAHGHDALMEHQLVPVLSHHAALATRRRWRTVRRWRLRTITMRWRQRT